MQELVRDCARLTESLAKTPGSGERTARCQDTLQMGPDTLPTWLSRWGKIFEAC